MKKLKFKDNQVLAILKQNEAGTPVLRIPEKLNTDFTNA